MGAPLHMQQQQQQQQQQQIPIAQPIRVGAAAAALPFAFFPYMAAPPPFRFGAPPRGGLIIENNFAVSAPPPPLPLEPEEPPPLWIRVLVSPFALIYLAIKWILYFVFTFTFVWLPEFLCVTLPIAINDCCAPVCPAIERCMDSFCRGLHTAGIACCSVVRQVERAGGAAVGGTAVRR